MAYSGHRHEVNRPLNIDPTVTKYVPIGNVIMANVKPSNFTITELRGSELGSCLNCQHLANLGTAGRISDDSDCWVEPFFSAGERSDLILLVAILER